MELDQAIQLVALHAVLTKPQEYRIRKVCRWYSRTFSTPLNDVYALPLHDVFQAYWESQFEDMDAEELEDVRTELLETPEQRKARIREEERQAVEADEFARQVAEEELSKRTPDAPRLEDILRVKSEPIAPKMLESEPDLPPPQVAPPDIKMVFVSDEDFEKEIEGFGLMSQPPKQSK